jgi:hypothetical protein
MWLGVVEALCSIGAVIAFLATASVWDTEGAGVVKTSICLGVCLLSLSFAAGFEYDRRNHASLCRRHVDTVVELKALYRRRMVDREEAENSALREYVSVRRRAEMLLRTIESTRMLAATLAEHATSTAIREVLRMRMAVGSEVDPPDGEAQSDSSTERLVGDYPTPVKGVVSDPTKRGSEGHYRLWRPS